MSSVAGRPVVASGVIHFIGAEVAETSSLPILRFREAPSRPPQSITPLGEGDGFAFDVNIDPNTDHSGFAAVDFDGIKYKIAIVVSRFEDLPDGPFYEARYSITR